MNIRNLPDISVRGASGTFQGETTQSGDAFMSFDTPENGTRAGMINIHNHYASGQTDVTSLITSLSPPSENDTADYITAVATGLGVPPNADIGYIVNGPGMVTLANLIIKEEGNTNVDTDPEAVQNAYNDYSSKYSLTA